MENATKALLIAAAVLIVIILIGFGMAVMNSSGDSLDQAEAIGDTMQTETTTETNKTMEAMGYEYVEDTDTTKEGNQPGWVKK